jgi:hypothetical protein
MSKIDVANTSPIVLINVSQFLTKSSPVPRKELK